MKNKTLIPRGGYRPDKYGLALKLWVYDLDKDGDHVASNNKLAKSERFENANQKKNNPFYYRFSFINNEHF
jgi:hypothetical protein